MNDNLTPQDMDLQDLVRIIELDADLVGRIVESCTSLSTYTKIHHATDLSESLTEIAEQAKTLQSRLRQQIAKMRHPHYAASLRK